MSDAELERRLLIASAPAWRPEPDTTLRNVTIVAVRKGESEYGPYPIVVFNTPEDPVYRCFHAFHFIAKQALAELHAALKRETGTGITEGTVIPAVRYAGKRRKNKADKDGNFQEYHDYVIITGLESDGDDSFSFDS